MTEEEPRPRSRRRSIRSVVLNRTLGKWVRVVDLLLEHHVDEGKSIEDEAEVVVKQAVLLMVGQTLSEEDAILFLESSKLKLPKRLDESSSLQIKRWIDGRPDPDASPGPKTPPGLPENEELDRD